MLKKHIQTFLQPLIFVFSCIYEKNMKNISWQNKIEISDLWTSFFYLPMFPLELIDKIWTVVRGWMEVCACQISSNCDEFKCAFLDFFCQKVTKNQFLKKRFLFRRILIQEQEEKIRISKNIRSIVWQFTCVWCFSFFHFFIFYAKLKFCATLVMVIFKQGNQALYGAIHRGGFDRSNKMLDHNGHWFGYQEVPIFHPM